MQGQRADDEQPTNSVPVLRYSEDFASMVGADGRRVCSDWSLKKMNEFRLCFCGSNSEYVLVDFEKDEPRTKRFVHWRSGSRVLELEPPVERLKREATRR